MWGSATRSTVTPRAQRAPAVLGPSARTPTPSGMARRSGRAPGGRSPRCSTHASTNSRTPEGAVNVSASTPPAATSAARLAPVPGTGTVRYAATTWTSAPALRSLRGIASLPSSALGNRTRRDFPSDAERIERTTPSALNRSGRMSGESPDRASTSPVRGPTAQILSPPARASEIDTPVRRIACTSGGTARTEVTTSQS